MGGIGSTKLVLPKWHFRAGNLQLSKQILFCFVEVILLMQLKQLIFSRTVGNLFWQVSQKILNLRHFYLKNN